MLQEHLKKVELPEQPNVFADATTGLSLIY